MADYEYYYDQYRHSPRYPTTPQRDLIDYHSSVSTATYNIWARSIRRPITTTYIDGSTLLGIQERPYSSRGIFPKGKSRRQLSAPREKKINTGDTAISLVPVDKPNPETTTNRSEKTRSPLSSATTTQYSMIPDLRQRSAATRNSRIFSATVYDDNGSESRHYSGYTAPHTNSAWVRRFKSMNESQALTDLLRDHVYNDKVLLRKRTSQKHFQSSSISTFDPSSVRRRRMNY